jgi:predicted CoA-binding protein
VSSAVPSSARTWPGRRSPAKELWLQSGIVPPEARRIAEEAGLAYVEDACTMIVHRLQVAKRL